jgi:hypothetical protein
MRRNCLRKTKKTHCSYRLIMSRRPISDEDDTDPWDYEGTDDVKPLDFDLEVESTYEPELEDFLDDLLGPEEEDDAYGLQDRVREVEQAEEIFEYSKEEALSVLDEIISENGISASGSDEGS